MLRIGEDSCLGTVPANPTTNITFTGNGTLQFDLTGASGALAISPDRNILINSGATATFDLNGNRGSVGGVISGSGGLAVINSTGMNRFGLLVFALSETSPNTYTGPTTINGGAVRLSYTSGDNIALLNANNTLYLGGIISATAATSGNPTNQVFGANLNLIADTSSTVYTTSTMALAGTTFGLTDSTGRIARGSGSTLSVVSQPNVNFTVGSGVSNTSNSILGGWATAGTGVVSSVPSVTDWAVVSGGNIVPYSSVGVYINDIWSSANNTTVTTNSSPASGSTTNSLRFNNATANTITLAGTNVISSGGILVTANVAANSIAISGGSLTSGNGTDLIVNQFNTTAGTNLTISSAIVNNGATPIGLTIAGHPVITGGTVIVRGANTYSGPTAIDAGTLQAGAANTIPAMSAVVLSSSAALNLAGFSQSVGSLASAFAGPTVTTTTAATFTVGNDGSSTSYGGVLTDGSAGALAVVKTGGGTLTLTNPASAYSGGLTINGGTLRTGADNVIPTTEAVALGAAGTLALAGNVQTIGSLTGTGTVANNSNIAAALTVGNNGAIATFAGVLTDSTAGTTGALSLTKIGAGTFTLTTPANQVGSAGGYDTLTGSTTAAGGTLLLDLSNLSTSTSLINPNSVLTLAAATLGINDRTGSTASVQSFNATALSIGASAISIDTNGNTNGSSALALGTISRATGGTVDFGTLPTVGSITAVNANGGGILGGWATVGGGTTWAVSGGNGSAAGSITALNSYTNDAWASGNNTTVTLASNNIASATTNSLRFNSPSADTVALSGTNTITSGGILLTPGVLGNNETITGGTLKSANSQDLIVNQFDKYGALTIGSIVANNGPFPIGLTKSGPGTLALTNASNSYSGGTFINQGTLSIGADGDLGAVPTSPTTNLTFSGAGGTLQFTAGATISGNRSMTIGTGSTATIDSRASAVVYSGVVGGAGGLTVISSTGSSGNSAYFSLAGGSPNTYAGPTTVFGGNLVLDYSNGWDIQKLSLNTLNLGGAIDIAPNRGSGFATVQTLATNIVLIADSSSVFSPAASVAAINSYPPARLTLTTGSGGVTRNPGTTLNFNTVTLSGEAEFTYFFNNGLPTPNGIIGGWATVTTLDGFSGNVIGTDWATIGTVSDVYHLSYSNAIVALASYTNDTWGGTTNTTVTASFSPAGNATTNSLRFNAATAATVNLSGLNTITSGGILVTSNVGANNNQITGGSLTSGNGVDLIVNQFNTAGTLTISAAIVNNGATPIGLTLGANPLSGTGGTLILTNSSNSYTGPTVINAGTVLQANSANVIPAASAVVLSGIGTLNLNGNNQSIGSLASISTGTTVTDGTSTTAAPLTVGNDNTSTTYNGTIVNGSGSLALVKVGGGTLTLTNINTYSGGTTITGGTLNINADGALGATSANPNITFNGNAGAPTLQFADGFSGLFSGSRNIVVTSGMNGTLDTRSNNISVGGTISLAAATAPNSSLLKKQGNGTLTILAAPSLGNNSALQVNAGTLRLNVASAPAIGGGVTAAVTAGATLELAGSVSALGMASGGSSGVVSVTNNSTAAATGGLHVTGTNQQAGAIAGVGNSVVESGASLTAYQIKQNALTINGTGTVTLVPSGSGTTTNPAAPNNINFSSNVASLAIGGTANAWTGTLDIGNNGLVIQYGGGTDPYATIANMIHSGYANGQWSGTGITSSLARAAVLLGSPTPALNIGLIDFVPNGPGFGSSIVFEGQTIATSAVLVRLTYMDDLVLSGDMAQANATSDALFFAANYGSGTTWHVGDITHDGLIDTNDALLFAANYVVGLPSLDGTTGNAAELAGGNAAVPEPSGLILALIAACALRFASRRALPLRAA